MYDVVKGSHLAFQTVRAQIDLITNPHFGRMLFIDGVVQSSTSDEILYHDALVRPVMEGRAAERVLVAGGAEGATLREIQNYDALLENSVKEMVMVDWDKELVHHMSEEEPWSQGAFDDPRVKLVFDDIEKYLDETKEPFDTVLLDLLDPESEEEADWLLRVVKKGMNVLTKNGRMSFNAGLEPKFWKKLSYEISDSGYDIISEEDILVPCYQRYLRIVTVCHRDQMKSPLTQTAMGGS